MLNITLKLPRPHDAQRQILDGNARYKVIACGRRFGKTELFVNALLNGNSHDGKGALGGYPVAYVSLTYKNVRELWGRLVDTIPDTLIRYKNESRLFLELVTGGSIECWTFERFTSARGRAYMGICLDEAAQTRNLKEAWEDVFIAMLIDYSGWALIGSTPQGFNHFYDLYQMGESDEFDDWQAWQFSSYDNPHMPRGDIDNIKKMLPDIVFEREYMASFRVSEGLVFPTYTHENESRDAVYNPDLEVYWFVDDGYAHGEGIGTTSHHPRVILFAHQMPNGGFDIFDEYYRTLQLADVSIKECLDRPYKHPRLALVDSAAAELRGRLSAMGIPNGPASHKISEGIKVVRRFICDGQGVRLLRINPDKCPNTCREMRIYQFDPHTMNVHAGEPVPLRVNDHSPSCMRYGLYNFR